jgi:hypothetical protein
MIPVIDLQKKTEIPWHEFVQEFGAPKIKPLPPSTSGWRIVRLEVDRSGGNSAFVTVLGPDNKPKQAEPVAFYWPDANQDPGCGPAGAVLPEINAGRCFSARTKEDGRVDFAMGRGAYYFAPGVGPHAAWMYGQESEVILGLGMLGGTEHWHYNVVFQWSQGNNVLPSPPEQPAEPGEGSQPQPIVERVRPVPITPLPPERPGFSYDVPFPVPTEVSGHRVTGRGVHWGSHWYHDEWIAGWMGWNWQDWIGWARSMHLSWAVLLSAGDSALLPHKTAANRSAAQILLDAGIIPLVRFPSNLPDPFSHVEHVDTLVKQVASYNVPAYILLGNEFHDPREWKEKKHSHKKKPKQDTDQVPRDWQEVGFAWWVQAARTCIEHGAYVGFPDGPDYATDPFQFMKDLPGKGYLSAADVDDFFRWWEDGKVFFAGHFYGLNRPPDYPDDPISREGSPLSEERHRELLGPFYDAQGWCTSLDLINRQRVEKAWAVQGKTRPEFSACWRSWERVAGWMRTHFGRVMPMALTEGGWTPGAIAGTTQETIDDRWPKPTPEIVAQYTLYAFDQAIHPMFAQCPWIAADTLMRGKGEWEGDAWRTGSYLRLGYDIDMPVVEKLRQNPPLPQRPPRRVLK